MKDGKYFIGFDGFNTNKGERSGVINLLNQCTIKDNAVCYKNKDGVDISITLKEFNERPYTWLVKKSDVDIKDSLYWWFNEGNYINRDKKFILDETIDNNNNENTINYTKYGWYYTIVMKLSDDSVRYNIVPNF